MLAPSRLRTARNAQRRGELDRLLGQKVLVGDALRSKLYGRTARSCTRPTIPQIARTVS